MRSGTCPKCGSTDVYMKDDGFQVTLSIRLKFMSMKVPRFDDYICMSCGFSERYIRNLNEITDVKEQWTKVR